MDKIASSYRSTFWARLFPFLHWSPLVNPRSLRADLLAGLSGSVVVLPQGVAFAMIAGMPPVYGLYTAMVPPIIAALFGSSRHLVSGPTTVISILVFATVSKFATPGSEQFVSMALTLTFFAGVYQLALGLARMGALVNFVSESVVVGFTAGAAVLIATSQLNNYFGLHIPTGESFLHTWLAIFKHIDDVNPYVTLVASVTLAALIALMRWRSRWPNLLIAITVGGILATALRFLDGAASEITLVGALPAQLPPLSMPDLSLGAIRQLGSGALAIAMLGLVEAVAIARAVGSHSGQRINGSQEFIGQGLANIVGSFFSSYASSGSFTRTGLNYTSGAVTPLSAIFAATSLVLIVLLAAPLAAYLPMPSMAAVLLVVAYRLIDLRRVRTIIGTSKRETAVLATTFFATLFVELEFAIYVGVMLSLVIYLMRTSRPGIVSRVPDPDNPGRHFATDPELPECPQLKIVRVDGSLFFGAIGHVQQSLRNLYARNPGQKHLLIIGNGINFIDISGADMLAREARERRDLGGALYLAKIKDEVYSYLQRGGFTNEIGRENIFATKSDAIETIFQHLDYSICERCTARIFLECKRVPYKGSSQDAAAPKPPPGRSMHHRGV